MAYEKIKVETDGGVVVITLNAPEAMNAFIPQMMNEVSQELDRIEADPAARVLVLTGTGRGFCTGADMRAMVRDGGVVRSRPIQPDGRYAARLDPAATRTPSFLVKLRKLEKPTIAAVNGYAVGGGLGIALACDIRIASEQAKFNFIFTRRGVSPSDGSAYLLPRLIGLSKALEMAYTADMVDGQEAYRIGLASRVVPHDQLMPAAMELAKKIAKGPPIAQALDKYMMTKFLTMTFEDAMIWVGAALNVTRETEDHHEAVRAYAEKRPPQFKGK